MRSSAGGPRLPGLADVLPSVAVALGASDRLAPLEFPRVQRVVVVLADGLGEQLLADRGGHSPYLRRLRAQDEAQVLRVGFSQHHRDQPHLVRYRSAARGTRGGRSRGP
jgi:hypothetical protein